MDNLGDFFSLIGEGKKKKEEEKKEIIGEVSLSDLFASLSKEKKKFKEKEEKKLQEKKEILAQAKVFETFLFTENPKVEKSAKKAVKVLEKELLNLKNTSYNSIDRLMKGICVDFDITPLKLHNEFKKKHGIIPDEWVKTQKEEVDTKNWKDDYVPTEIESINIIEPEPLKKEDGEINENIEKSMEILDKLIPEEEKINESETEISRLKREMEQLRKMVYETVRTSSAQGGGGEVRLEFLDDVDRNTAKVNNRFLKYDSSVGKWVGGVGGGVTTFTDLDDVDATTTNGNSVVFDSNSGKFIGTDILGSLRQIISDNVNDGDVIVYSASDGRFIATSQGNIGAGRTSLSLLDDVNTTGISTNDVLIFNGTDFEFTTPFEILDRADGSDDDTLDYGSF